MTTGALLADRLGGLDRRVLGVEESEEGSFRSVTELLGGQGTWRRQRETSSAPPVDAIVVGVVDGLLSAHEAEHVVGTVPLDLEHASRRSERLSHAVSRSGV